MGSKISETARMYQKLIFKKNFFTNICSIVFILFACFGCSTDIDVLGNWQEVPVVYGLLNQNDSVQYIRISKAYMGEGDAYVMAQEDDSIYYNNELHVQLERIKDGNVVETITLNREESNIKDTGNFAAPIQVLYTTTANLEDDESYNLVIENNSSGLVANASTELVKNFSIVKPKTTEKINWNLINTNYKVEWNTAENGRLYQLTIRFNYTEVNKITSQTEDKYINWVFGEESANDLEGGDDMQESIDGESFYTFIASMIKENDEVNRYIGTLDFSIAVAGDKFATYMEINQVSSSLIQDKPLFTNIENGIGIFSSRFNKTISSLEMTNSSQDSIRYGIHTQHLGFQ